MQSAPDGLRKRALTVRPVQNIFHFCSKSIARGVEALFFSLKHTACEQETASPKVVSGQRRYASFCTKHAAAKVRPVPPRQVVPKRGSDFLFSNSQTISLFFVVLFMLGAVAHHGMRARLRVCTCGRGSIAGGRLLEK